MTWEIAFSFIVLGLALGSFLWEKISTDLTALVVFSTLLIAASLYSSESFPTTAEIIGVLANPAPMTIACMFILSAALEKTGAIDNFATLFSRFTKLGYFPFILAMGLLIGSMAAFVNNTPVVVIMMPIVLKLAKEMRVPASKLLIPLSYISILGGTCTLIGTSTNLLCNGIIQKAGLPGLGMFELGKIGLVVSAVGIGYIALLGKKLLPVRETLTSILSADERKEFITEAYVKPGSDLIGQKVKHTRLGKSRGIRVIEILRDGVGLVEDSANVRLEAGDRLVMACRPSGIAEAREFKDMDFIAAQGLDMQQIAAHEGSIVEGVVSPNSSIIGRTVREINFRQRFRMVTMAVHRGGKNLREKIEILPLKAGDILLMMGTDTAIENLRSSNDILLLDRPHIPSKKEPFKLQIAIAALLSVITIATFNLLPIVVAAIAAVAVVLTTGCVKAKDAYQSIEWNILILIYGMMGLGVCMEETGASALVVNTITDIVRGNFQQSWQPYVMLAAVYTLTWILTEILSNQATVVLMTPLVISMGVTLGVDPRPFIIAVCIGSSLSFTTPIGYQTNTYVYSAGGYKFTDFIKFGLPLNLICLVICIFLIPLIWSF